MQKKVWGFFFEKKKGIFSFKQRHRKKKNLMPTTAVPNQKRVFAFTAQLFIPQMWKKCTTSTSLKEVVFSSEIVFQRRVK